MSAFFLGDGWLARADGEHDAEAERDEHADTNPDAADMREDAGLIQRRDGADDEDEVANEVEMNEAHGGDPRGSGLVAGIEAGAGRRVDQPGVQPLLRD